MRQAQADPLVLAQGVPLSTEICCQDASYRRNPHYSPSEINVDLRARTAVRQNVTVSSTLFLQSEGPTTFPPVTCRHACSRDALFMIDEGVDDGVPLMKVSESEDRVLAMGRCRVGKRDTTILKVSKHSIYAVVVISGPH